MTKLLIKLFVRNYNDTESQNVRSRYITLGSTVGILCNILLFVIKFTIGFISGAVSITADAFNNLSDIGSSVVTALGYKLSEKPADKEHPFGHGRIEYMSGLVVAVLIIMVGVELFKTSYSKLINPTALAVDFVTIIALVVSIIIKFWMFLFNRKIGKTVNSSALVATAQDSINDSFATLAVLFSVFVALIFNINIDPYVGIGVALFIIYSGFKTIKETIDPLLGTPPDEETILKIEDTVKNFDECFLGIHDLIIHNYGPGRSFASLHVEVPSDINIIMCHEKIDACEKKLLEELKMNVVIHMDPIESENTLVADTKEKVLSAVKLIDDRLSIHDFRMINGEKQINLIFDVVLPNGFKLSEEALKADIRTALKKIDERFETVITVDRDFVSRQ